MWICQCVLAAGARAVLAIIHANGDDLCVGGKLSITHYVWKDDVLRSTSTSRVVVDTTVHYEDIHDDKTQFIYR